MGRQKIIIGITILFVTVSGIFYAVNYGKNEEAVFIAEENEAQTMEGLGELSLEYTDTSGEQKTEQRKEEPEKQIYVHICGQVAIPGVYCLLEDSRVTDLIELAGGFTELAARDYVNLAQKLLDGQKIYVPSLEEAEGEGLEMGLLQQTEAAASSKVNLNLADKDMLMTLTGIGESKAEAIIQYREKNGGFSSIEEIKQIEGIKDGVFNKIKDEIEV